MTERRPYRPPRGRPYQLPHNFTDLRQLLDYKQQQRGLEEGKPSNIPPPDPPSLLRDSLRGDDSPQTHRNNHIPSYSYSRRSRGSFRKRGGGNRFMQNEPDKERKGKFSVQYNIKVEVSTETGDRKCTIDTTETHNQSRNRGNYSGRRNFRGGRRGRSGYRGQYFYRGQNRRYVNKDSSEQGNSSTEHSVKDAPIAKVPIIDAEEENWDNDDAYANNLNEENNSKEEDSTKQGEYGDYEAEAEYYEEDYPDENADHGIENNNSLDDRCENTLSSNDGDYKDLDVHERSGAEVEETNTASNNSQERTIGIGNEIKQQTNEIEYSKQNTTSNEQLEIDSKSLEQLTLNDQTKLGPKSDDVCGKVNPNDETVHEGYENELSKEDTTSDEQLEKDYGGSQQLISEGKPDIELKSNDISNNKVSSKEEIVVSTAKKNTAEEENKHNE